MRTALKMIGEHTHTSAEFINMSSDSCKKVNLAVPTLFRFNR